MRLGRRKTFSLTSSRRGPAITPQTCAFLPKTNRSGNTSEMLAAPVLAGDAHARLHFVKDQQHVVFIADPAKRLQPFAAKMVVAAFALDRLNDDGGDVHAAFAR